MREATRAGHRPHRSGALRTMSDNESLPGSGVPQKASGEVASTARTPSGTPDLAEDPFYEIR